MKGAKRAIAGALAVVQLWLATSAPAFAQDPGPALLGVTSSSVTAPRPAGTLPPAPVLGMTAAEATPWTPPAPDGSWLGKFGGGVWEGFRDALPNLAKQFRDSPWLTTAVLLGGVGVALVAPQVALLAGALLMADALFRAGGDPRRTGQVLGETAFWGVAGAAAVRGAQTASRMATAIPGPIAMPAPPGPAVRWWQLRDKVTSLPIRPGQQHHGQLIDGLNGRPLVANTPWWPNAKLTQQQHVDFAAARMRVEMARHPHVGETWARGDVDPHTLLARKWTGVNSHGTRNNCLYCAFAGDRTMAGQPMVAGPENRAFSPVLSKVEPRIGTDRRALEKVLQRTSRTYDSPDAIGREIVTWGDGARGIVTASVKGHAHAFNVVAWKGKAYFLDFQTGTPADLGGWTSWSMVRTYP